MTIESWTLLQQKLAEQYLNTFFRELEICLHDYHHHQPPNYRVPLANGTINLYFSLQHFSLSGYHRYDFPIHVKKQQQTQQIESPQQLISLLCDALSEQASQDAVNAMETAIYNSLKHCDYFFEERKKCAHLKTVSNDFIAAEQGLLLGHPFHVTSKSMTGFDNNDMHRYSPELGTAFKLHYFAVHPDLILTRTLTDQSIPIDPVAEQSAADLLPQQYKSYRLLPCHPWQANFLLQQPELKPLLDSDSILSLGPLGDTVWPTSSVRTVFSPNSGLFIKLSLDVRITNFIRNNPPGHLHRAMDASEFIHNSNLSNKYDGLIILPELGSQTLTVEGLESSFAVLYRQGLTPQQTRSTRVVAALVEECPNTGRLPLSQFIHTAALNHDTTPNVQFVTTWWRSYLYASLIPSLTLFAQTGVSLEAHLQNSLMLFSKGWPQALIARDMEGCSIAPRTKFNYDSSSSAAYSEQEAWFRYRYYVVVNHIAHVLSAIARHHSVTDRQLWTVVSEVLSDPELDDDIKPYAQQLLTQPTLPAKGNMLSTLKGCGESPVWVNIPNPLANLEANLNTTLNPPHRDAHQRVLSQLVEALVYEKVLPFSWQGSLLTIEFDPDLTYLVEAQNTKHFDRIRIKVETLVRVTTQSTQAGCLSLWMEDMQQLELADTDRWLQFYDELFHTMTKHAQVLSSPSSTPLRELPYVECEAKINNGHLYHPSFKSRLGFTLEDNQRFGPELAAPFHLIWLAVDKSQAQLHAQPEYDHQFLFEQSFSAQQQSDIIDQLQLKQLTPQDVYFLPVHPWQWQHIGATYFSQRPGIHLLNTKGHDYLPQQSIRTLSNMSQPQSFSVKLALSITNTSTSRVLAPHTVANAAPISQWLNLCVSDDSAWQRVTKPILLQEVAGLSVTAPEQLPAQYGALACIWRQSIDAFLQEGQSATPVTGLMQLDIDGQPLIAPWVRRHGLTSWLQRLIDNVYIPVMHILWHHGLALESHAQNMVLIHEQGLPVGVALKDFHDGVRFSPHYLSDIETLPALTDAPDAHAAVNPNSFLVTDDAEELRDFTQDALCFVNLAELGWFLESQYNLDGTDFWQLVRQRIEHYQQQHPYLKDRFALFDFFAPTISVEQLASRRFLPEQRLRVMRVANPLGNNRTAHDQHQNECDSSPLDPAKVAS